MTKYIKENNRKIKELQEEADKLYAFMERQALTSVNSKEDIMRHTELLEQIRKLKN